MMKEKMNKEVLNNKSLFQGQTKAWSSGPELFAPTL